ncbi:hypothetical protein N9923_00715 [bacterium]|nr:hypothetical protein [bacterium]
MDNFDLQKYLASGKIHADNTTLTEAKKQGYDDREDESLGARKGAEKDKKQSMKARRDDSYGKFGKRDAEKKGKNKINKEGLEEDARTDAEQEGYKDGFDDAKDDVKDALSKMKVSELKAKIKETILAELSLSEADEEVDVDIDVEDEVEVEAGADDIEIERPGVKTTVDVGLSPEEEVVQDSLKAAMDAAQALGNQKLADQIGNTITFFTREFVVGQNTD